MESYSSSLGTPFEWEEPGTHSRGSPQMSPSRVPPPPQEPDPAKAFRLPSPLGPDAPLLSEPNVPKPQPPSDHSLPELPNLSEFLNSSVTDISSLDLAEGTSNPETRRYPALPFISLRAVENSPSLLEEDAPHKRARLEGERPQLPAPRTQSQSSRPFGPVSILNGLNEPPPNAALLPPIETDANPTILTRPSRDDDEEIPARPTGRGPNIRDIIDLEAGQADSTQPTGLYRPNEVLSSNANEGDSEGEGDKVKAKRKRKYPRKYRYWTKEESFELMQGIARCGVGRWKQILAQEDLKFNRRTSSNLKDRFRVCCPWAYYKAHRRIGATEVNRRVAQFVSQTRTGAGRPASYPSDPQMPNVAAGTCEPDDSSESSESLEPESAVPQPTKPERTCSNAAGKDKVKPPKKNNGTRGSAALAQRSKSSLESLGLDDPVNTVKSTRMRVKFTKQEDDSLFHGYIKHGFNWSAIQRDAELKLSHRKSTVLRDRFRFKFPETYKSGGVDGIKYVYRVQGSTHSPEMLAVSEQPPQPGQRPKDLTVIPAIQPYARPVPPPPPREATGTSAPQTIPSPYPSADATIIPPRGGKDSHAFPPTNTVPSTSSPVREPSGPLYPGLTSGSVPPNSTPSQPSEPAGGATNSPQPIFPFSDDETAQGPVTNPLVRTVEKPVPEVDNEEEDARWREKSDSSFWHDLVH